MKFKNGNSIEGKKSKRKIRGYHVETITYDEAEQ